MPTKLLIIHWGTTGGGPKFTYDMARGIENVGGVDLFASVSRDADNFSEWEALRLRLLPVRTYRTRLSFLTGLIRLPFEVLRLRRFILANEITHVYSGMLHIWQSLTLRAWLPRDVAYIASVHDGSEHPGDEHILRRLCMRSEIARASTVVTYSSHVQQIVGRQLASASKAVLFVPMGIDTNTGIPRPAVSARTTVVGFFGRLVKYKGLDLFVDAVRILREQGYDVRGKVYGSGEVRSQLRRSSDGFIDWNIGWVAKEDVSLTLEGFDILALPYVEASQSGVVSVAASLGLPIVATPVGGLAEQILRSGSGVVAPDVTADGIASAIRGLMDDPGRYEAISRSGIGAVRNGNGWVDSARVLLELAV